MNALTIHNTWCLKLKLATTLAWDVAQTIDWVTQWVYHAAHVGITNWHGEHLTGAVDLHALFDTGELTEDNHTNLALV